MANYRISATTTGTLTALLSFFSSLPLVVLGLGKVGASPEQISTALLMSCLAIAALGAWLTWKLRMPVLLSWSVPGAALLAALTITPRFPVAVFGFTVAAAITALVALMPSLTRLMERLPVAIASGLLAGVIFPFALGLFQAFNISVAFAGAALLSYLLGRRLWPAHTLAVVAMVMGGCLFLQSPPAMTIHDIAWPSLIAIWPDPDSAVLLVISVPLLMLSLVSQSLPGLTLLRGQRYAPPTSSLLLSTSVTSLLLALFGVFGINLAPVSSAMCAGPEDELASVRRRWASFAYAGTYLLLGLASAYLVKILQLLPQVMLWAFTGIAMLVPLMGALHRMVENAAHREPAVLTFVASASGLSLMGIGASFWALLIGMASYILLIPKSNERTTQLRSSASTLTSKAAIEASLPPPPAGSHNAAPVIATAIAKS